MSAMTPSDPPKRILVMVVEEGFAEIFPAMLRAAGYQCDAAYGDDAISDALKGPERYDFVFCQVATLERYPEFLSWALFRKAIPIIAAAARPWKDIPKLIRERCIHLPIPFEKDQMVALVRETIENHAGKSPR